MTFRTMLAGSLLAAALCIVSPLQADVVLPSLVSKLVCRYDFEHPVSTNAAKESDLGFSGTDINLINGGGAMRTNDGAYAASGFSLQTQQVNPVTTGNDDWKAGIYLTNGLASLVAFNAVAGITLMGWVKPTGTNPNLDTTTPSTTDYYNAVGLFGLLAGNSEGHTVRALLEVIDFGGTFQLIALGRRIDGGASLTLAAANDWRTVIPSNTWTHLTATFDFDNGTMALYRNGAPLPASYANGGDPWGVIGGPEPDVTSASNPAGIKIGGSFPQNTQERNAFNGRFDDLMFFNKVLTAAEVAAQYANFAPTLGASASGGQITVSWPAPAAGYVLQWKTNLTQTGWQAVNVSPTTNGSEIFATLPALGGAGFFRLKGP